MLNIHINPLAGILIAVSIGVVLMILVASLYFHFRKKRKGESAV